MNFKSKRGMPLILLETPTKPTLTAEFYVKWYELYVVAAGQVATLLASIEFSELEEHAKSGESAFVDHVPNPEVIERFAEANGYELDPIFIEVAYGRWHLEVKSP